MNAFRNAGFACFLGLSIVGSSFAATRYVNVSNATPAAPYTTWESASVSIQPAIDVAVSGDEILVAPGVYLVANAVNIPAGKTLALRSTLSREAVIDAQRLDRGVYISGANSLVEGFTVRNGLTVGAGGGVVMMAASTVRDCRVVSNQAADAGGIVLRAAPTLVENCTIESNLAASAGGGVLLYGSYAGLLNRCVIRGNVATNYGGGVSAQAAGTVSNCWIADNRAVLMEGGGVCIDEACTLINTVLVGNQATGVGGGVFSSKGGYVAHCTVVSNISASAGGGIRSAVAITSWNNVVYYNVAPVGPNFSDTFAVLSNNCTTPSLGGSNFTNAPAFVDLAGRNYHLAEGSPCIDAGADTPAVGDDYDGNSRPRSGSPGDPARYDVGAFEYGVGGAVEGDFDSDGIADLVVYHPATGNWHGLLSTASGGILPFGWSAALPVPADFDGDGEADLAVYHPATGNWHIRESDSETTHVTQFGWSATVPLPGDYDGDGRADLAVYHPAAGRWYFLCSTAGRYSVQWGWSSAIPVPADYDGDGITDIAVYHPASGLWQILKSSTGGAINASWGWSSAIPVPADYDGDGQADVAVFHRASGTWYISYSGGGSRTQAFGWSTTIPVAADYDGDGEADIAVYHPATGNWHILKSTTGGIRTQNWGWSATKPVLLYPLIHTWFGLP